MSFSKVSSADGAGTEQASRMERQTIGFTKRRIAPEEATSL
jgi:hypothetical protein